MCCGQKRNAMNARGTAPQSALNLRYEGKYLIHVRGSATGNLYRFSAAQPVQPVDHRDVNPMLDSELFRLSR